MARFRQAVVCFARAPVFAALASVSARNAKLGCIFSTVSAAQVCHALLDQAKQQATSSLALQILQRQRLPVVN